MKEFIKNRPVVTFIFIILFIFIALLSYFFYWAFYDLDRISKGEMLIESVSPDGTYTVKLYSSESNAISPTGIIGELNFNKSNKEKRIIYWSQDEKASIEWLNNNTVIINSEKLRIPGEKYDYRHK